MLRRSALAILCLSALAWAEQPVQKAIDARARLAFKNDQRAGWVPILLDNLRNRTGQDLDLVITVEADEGRPNAVAYVALPRQEMSGKKRLFLYLYDPGGWGSMRRKVVVRKRGEETPIHEEDLSCNSFNGNGILVVSSGTAAEVQLHAALSTGINGASYYSGNQPTPLSCPADAMPDRWVAYSQADLVVLADLSWADVDDKAWKALVDWVRSGGTVLISPRVDEGWFRDPHLKDLCDPGPVRIGTANLRDSGFGPPGEVPYAFLPKKNTSVPSGLADGSPILALWEADFGHVYLLATDITSQAYLGWRGLPAMWSTITGGFAYYNPHDLMDRGQAEGLTQGYWRNEDAGFPMRRVAGYGMRKLPDMWGLVILVVLFVLVVGPLNFLLLRRLQRPLWALWTIPSVSILFVVFIVGMGYVTKGSSTVVQRVTFVDLIEGHDLSVEAHYACVRSAAPGDHSIAWDPLTSPRALRPLETRYDVMETGQFTVEGFPLHMWEEGYFRGDAVRRVRGTIEVGRGADGLPEVRNRSAWNVRAAVWVDFTRGVDVAAQTTGMYATFAALPPGQTTRPTSKMLPMPAGSRGKAVASTAILHGLDETVLTYLLEERYGAGNATPMLFAFVDGEDVPLTLVGRTPKEARTLTVLRVTEE